MLKKIIVFTIIFGSLGLGAVGDVAAMECYKHETVTLEAGPRAAMCSCGGFFRVAGTTYTSWKRTGSSRRCKDGYPWGDDLQESRTKIQEYVCSNCGGGYETKSTEYRWICYGHN